MNPEPAVGSATPSPLANVPYVALFVFPKAANVTDNVDEELLLS